MTILSICNSKHRILKLALLSTVCTIQPLSILPAVAGMTAGSKEPAYSLEEIVVTSRKREERLQDVPDSISAFTSSAIENANIKSVADVTSLVPNLSIVQTQQPGVDFLVIRGIGQARNQDPPVAVVIDGVQMTNAYALTQELIDIERIEVLKGPQGALYGRNAIGGAINIVTKKPGNELEGKIVGGVGNGGHWEAKGVLSGPIIKDKLFLRVAGSYEDFNGLINNVYLNHKVDFMTNRAFRGRLLFLPTDKLTLDFRASIQDLDFRGSILYTGNRAQ